MKTVYTFLILSILGFSASASTPDFLAELNHTATLSSIHSLNPEGLQWKVGDTMNYDISIAAFGKLGSMIKTVTKDEGTSLWMKETMNLAGRQDVAEIQLNKEDGKILKLIHNGQDQAIPDEQIEIISEDYTQITVPAGTFDVLHIVAKSKDVSKIEAWMNPMATVMDGAVKQVMATQFGDLTMDLTSFKHGN